MIETFFKSSDKADARLLKVQELLGGNYGQSNSKRS